VNKLHASPESPSEAISTDLTVDQSIRSPDSENRHFLAVLSFFPLEIGPKWYYIYHTREMAPDWCYIGGAPVGGGIGAENARID